MWKYLQINCPNNLLHVDFESKHAKDLFALADSWRRYRKRKEEKLKRENKKDTKSGSHPSSSSFSLFMNHIIPTRYPFWSCLQIAIILQRFFNSPITISSSSDFSHSQYILPYPIRKEFELLVIVQDYITSFIHDSSSVISKTSSSQQQQQLEKIFFSFLSNIASYHYHVLLPGSTTPSASSSLSSPARTAASSITKYYPVSQNLLQLLQSKAIRLLFARVLGTLPLKPLFEKITRDKVMGFDEIQTVLSGSFLLCYILRKLFF
jgi:hypothetical protein